MAIITTAEMDGTTALAAPNEKGKVYEHTWVIDASVDNLASGDFVQLGYKPANAVITEMFVAEDATGVGLTTVAVGIANTLVTTSLASTYIAAAVPTAIASVGYTQIVEDTAIAAPGGNTGILAALIGAEAETAQKIYIRIRYTAA